MELPILEPVCPAATPLDGPPLGGPSVVCGVLSVENTDSIAVGAIAGELVTAAGDPSTLAGFCCGPGSPVVDSVPDGGRAHYTACPVWRRSKEARWAREEVLAGDERGAIVGADGA